MPHISLAAEQIGTLWGLPVTNALFTTWFVKQCEQFVFVHRARMRKNIVLKSKRMDVLAPYAA